MSFQYPMSSFARSLVAMVVVGAVFATGCAGKSTGDDDEDGDNGGSSSVGGTAGASAGTSSGSSCVRACQRVQVCPEYTPVDCVAECRDLDAEAVAGGCSAPYQNYLACLVQSSDACNAVTGGECENAAEAYADCIIGGGSSGNCNSATAPPADCTALCQRAQACPDAPPTDCAASCAQELASMAELGCLQQYQSALACISACTNLCSITTTDCEPEFDALIDCSAL